MQGLIYLSGGDDEGDFEDAHLVQHLFHRMSLLDFHSYKLFLATYLLG